MTAVRSATTAEPMMDFADEIARQGLIKAVMQQQEGPDLRAFL
jgi:hypothetical protein